MIGFSISLMEEKRAHLLALHEVTLPDLTSQAVYTGMICAGRERGDRKWKNISESSGC